jgi:predicted O-methyltransferase YrrM
LAGESKKVKIVVGPAQEGLAALPDERIYDMAFIDADKPSNAIYYQECRRLVRKGGIIVGVPSFLSSVGLT